jgi:hypothetical protein
VYVDSVSTLTVQVQHDHLERLVKGPLHGLAELIWNALDADAESVLVDVELNDAGGIEAVTVADDGHGMTPERIGLDFGKLGGSWKKARTTTDGGRLVHGRLGEGRWASYGIGEVVQWDTIAEKLTGGRAKTRVVGTRSALQDFTVSDPLDVAPATPTGTIVTVRQLTAKARTELLRTSVLMELTTTFALYLQQYPVKVFWRGEALDPAALQDSVTVVPLIVEGVDATIEVVIIEWNTDVDRALHLCDTNGISYTHVKPGIQAPGFEFTAYLKWDGFKEKHDQILLGDMAEEPVPAVLEAAREAMRTHFKTRLAMRGAELIRSWKKDKSYPYAGEPTSDLELAERQLFEVVAVAAAPAVESIDVTARSFSLRLLKEAVERAPSSLHQVLQEVLNLTPERQEEFRELLERTTLSSLLASGRAVLDRLDFLVGLEQIVFDPDMRTHVKERSQLHRILANETWVFGDEYALTADDNSLTTALRDHVKLLGREDLVPADLDAEVTDSAGKRVVVDLMLSRVVEQHENSRRHLVVELKRPSVHVGLEEYSQIQKYATAVAEDSRFAHTDTKWEFWIVGDKLGVPVERMAHQTGRDVGVVFQDELMTVRAVPWAKVIQDSRHRLKFVQRSLEYQTSNAAGMDYLARAHGKYLPMLGSGAVPIAEAPAESPESPAKK